MSETKVDNPPDVVQDAPLKKAPEESGEGSASPPTSPSEGKSDNYFSRKFGNVLNRSLRKFRKSNSHDKNEAERQNGHEMGDKSPDSASPEKSPSSPKSPKTPDEKRSKFPRMFRTSKRSKSVDVVESEAASTSNVLDGEKKDASKEKPALATKYGEQRQVVVGGKALKEIEVTGEKQQETLPETRRHRRISKSRRAAEFEGDELKVQCRDLNPADYEGWLFKKSTGGPLHTVAWKQCWVVLKNGILYLYKTSFDIAAQHAYSVRNFSVAPVEEKRKHTFKLVPKNVPPEALQDAKGVVFACDSDADVEKWCDVLNKAALGFIIQQSPNSEKEEPIRRRCQSSAVRREKPKLNGVSKSHRARSTTFTGETTGLPSSFNRSGSTSRTRKISGSGSSSVLAVGNMFLAIDEPSNSNRTSNSDLSSIVYKEELDEVYKPRNHAKQQTANGTAGEDEIRMEVKKEVERINKHSKPTKPVEGKGPTVASAKKADIIRQEIMNLKEKESQKENSEEKHEASVRNEAGSETEVAQDILIVDEGEEEKRVSDVDDTTQVESVSVVKKDIEDSVEEAVEDNLEEKDEDTSKETEAEIELERENSSLKEETDSGISVEDYLKQLQVQEADVPVEEYIARMTEGGIIAVERDTLEDSEKQDIECAIYEVEEEGSSSDAQDFEVIIQKVDDQDTFRDVDDENDEDDESVEDYVNRIEKSEERMDIDQIEEERAESPRGMIPAKQQRMLMDAVLSLDYPSDSESETDDADEICHYANLERPSTPNGELSNEERGMMDNDSDDLNVIIDAPPGFENLENGGQQTYSKVREHNIQYGATQGGKPVIHHVFVKSAKPSNVAVEESNGRQDEPPSEKEETADEGRSHVDAEVEEESCLESIIEEKRLEVTESELQLDFDKNQEEEWKATEDWKVEEELTLKEDWKQEDPQLKELETKTEFQQEGLVVQGDLREKSQVEEHLLETRQMAEDQQTKSQEEGEEPLMELRMELWQETLKLERLQMEKQNDESDDIPSMQFDSKSGNNENSSVDESLRVGVSAGQNEAPDLSTVAGVYSTSNGSNEVSMECEQESITVDEDRRQELSLSMKDGKDIVENVDNSEVSRSQRYDEEPDEGFRVAEAPVTTIKIVKVSVKQRSKDTDYKIGEKAFESSV